MDPFLEGSLWTTVHSQLAAEIARQLAPLVLPKYVALTTERFVLDEPESIAVASGNSYPDAFVSESGVAGATETSFVTTAPVEIATVMPLRVPHFSVELRDTKNRRLVTAIELLSPTNKRSGRGEYLRRRRKILLSSAHLLEIDLLRRGQRVPMRKPLPAAEYFVFLSRVKRRPVTEIWPISLRQSLPTVPVPLTAPDNDVALDIQLAFNSIYDLLGYQFVAGYDEPPDVPLAPDDAAWAAECIRSFQEQSS